MSKKSEKLKKFLPSKQFIRIISISIGVCALILIGAIYFGSQSGFAKPALSVSSDTTLGDLLVQDSNNNGIPDWEETLYGLDPKGDGLKNKQIIDAKKQQIEESSGAVTDTSATTTQTAELSREMLSTILALQQSGNLTPDAIANLTDSLGQTIDAKRDNPQMYTIDDMQTTDDNSGKAIVVYEKSFTDALTTANNNGLGQELGIIYQALDPNSGPDNIKSLDKYIQTYATFAQDIIAIKTPTKIAQKSLSVANACALMSKSLAKIEDMYTDAASGLIGFDEYTTSYTSIQSDLPDLMQSLGIKIS